MINKCFYCIIKIGQTKTTAPFQKKNFAVANNIGAIFGATARILYYAFWLANQKAILTRKEFKKILSVLGWSETWEALTPVERRRIISITPIEVRKLSKAKRNGKIIDYQEVRKDVYKVQYSEYIFGEIVYKDRLNDFLARL